MNESQHLYAFLCMLALLNETNDCDGQLEILNAQFYLVHVCDTVFLRICNLWLSTSKYIHQGTYSSPWLTNVKNILNIKHWLFVWANQNTINLELLKRVLSIRLNDQFKQTWFSEVFASSKCSNYRIFKTELKLEDYLLTLSTSLTCSFTKHRCRHRRPIEIGCRQNVERNSRKCTKCDSNEIGDE